MVSIRNAMALALHTLQRREDISNLQWTSIKNGQNFIVQKKTGSLVKIAITSYLQEVLSKCRDDVVSPYIIHQPSKANKARRGRKLSANSLTKGFFRARQDCGY